MERHPTGARRLAVLVKQTLQQRSDFRFGRLVAFDTLSDEEKICILVWSGDPRVGDAVRSHCVNLGVDILELSPSCIKVFPTFGSIDVQVSDEDKRAAEEELKLKCSQAHAWLGWPQSSWGAVRDVIGGWPKTLKWIQTISAGADVLMEVVPENISVTRAEGKFDEQIAEWVLAYMLMHCKNMPALLELQKSSTWGKRQALGFSTRLLRGLHVLVHGYGSIGQRIGLLCSAVGANVVATRRSAQHTFKEGPVEVHPSAHLASLLPKVDFAVIALPLTGSTRGSFGASQLQLMKSDAVLINIARGEIVDWSAVRHALTCNKIGGYYTDVTVPEPLPDGHPDWQIPRLYITPHVTFLPIPGIDDDAKRFSENLRRYLAGEAMLGEVNRQLGY